MSLSLSQVSLSLSLSQGSLSLSYYTAVIGSGAACLVGADVGAGVGAGVGGEASHRNLASTFERK